MRIDVTQPVPSDNTDANIGCLSAPSIQAFRLAEGTNPHDKDPLLN